MNKENRIAHVFWAYAPHLGKLIAPPIVAMDPRAVIYLRDLGEMATAEKEFAMNKDWIAKLPAGRYGGRLTLCKWRRWKVPGRFSAMMRTYLCEFNLPTLCRIARGPKYWVLHGWWFSPVMMILMRLMGKKVILIHWGGHWGIPEGRLTKFFSPLSFTLLCRLYVLMSPEIRFYSQWMPLDRLATLPYWKDKAEAVPFVKYEDEQGKPIRSVIIGNSAWLLDQYDYILDRMRAGSWDRIVCMLNYGQEWETAKINAFVEKWRAKFGDAFYAWRDRVPIDEYRRIMYGSPYYICLHPTQVGLGAIGNGIETGKTIFVTGDNLEWFKEMGIPLNDASKVADFSFENLYKFRVSEKEQKERADALARYYTEKVNGKIWLETIDKAFGVV